MSITASSDGTASGRRLIYRHALVIRLTHWINVVCLAILLMSGLQIFNSHPALYFGNASDFDHPALAIGAEKSPDGAVIGVTRVFGHAFDTTGILGLSTGDGEPSGRGFPAWITIPSYHDLATGRRWHFFFGWLFVLNGLAYLVYSLSSGHAWRDLLPSGGQLKHIGRSAVDHLRLRFPRGEEATRYNVLQKLSYLAVICVLLPALVLSGLTMSPGLDAAFPWLVELFGGRQSARTVHFIAAWLMVLFVLVHVLMVLLSGVLNNLRSMITGRYAVEAERSDAR